MAVAVSRARWLLNEASSLQVPTTCTDDQGTNDLTINYATSDANWDSDGAGNKLRFNSDDHSAIATLSDIQNNGDLAAAFDGITEASFIVKAGVELGHANSARLFHIGGSGDNGEFGFTSRFRDGLPGDIRVGVRWNGQIAQYLVAGYPLVDAVYVAVVDTTQATDALRCRFFIDGVEQTQESSNIVANATITTDAADKHISIGNRPDLVRGLYCDVSYVEVFTGTLTAQEITDATNNVAANSDVNWAFSTLTGTGTLPADPSTLSGTGTRTVKGIGALSTDIATLSGSGARTVKSTGSLAASTALLTASGARTVKGTGTLPSQNSALNATTEHIVVGTSVLLSGNSSLSGVGERITTGTGLLVSDNSLISGTGTAFNDFKTGTGTLPANVCTLSGTGSRGVLTAITLPSSNSALSGTGTAFTVNSGTGILTTDSFTFSATGVGYSILTGTGTLTADTSLLDADGQLYKLWEGTGLLNTVDSQLSATGTAYTVNTGTGTLVSGNSSLDATGQLFKLYTGTGLLSTAVAEVTGEGLIHRFYSGDGTLNVGEAGISAITEIHRFYSGPGQLNCEDSAMIGNGTITRLGLESVVYDVFITKNFEANTHITQRIHRVIQL